MVILAPMEDVTDTVFRQIVASCAPPDVFFTEFTSAEGLVSKGARVVADRLVFTEIERPIVAQIWGHDPQVFYDVAQLLVEKGFDGIDINMGCPVRAVTKNGGGACLIKTPEIAGKIIAETRRGAGKLPVSVKTRIGFNTIVTQEWITFLLHQNLDMLTIHGRTAKEKSAVPAHWDEIGKAVKIRDALRVNTKIIGNGDVKNVREGKAYMQTYGVDGVMIGRGIFSDLWAFDPSGYTPTKEELLKIMKRHIELFYSTWGDKKPFQVLKKYFKIYINGFSGASDIREQAMQMTSVNEALHFIDRL